MSQWKTIKPEELAGNPFSMLGKDWALVTAGTKEHVNTMTVSWGGLGVMWGKPVAFVFIRPQRYTKTLIDKNNTFSLSFYEESYREMLSFMGTKSGKDIDKIKEQNLHLSFHEETPYFEEAKTVLCLKKLYEQNMEENCFHEKECIDKWYPGNDYHTMYVCEITSVLIK